MARSMWKQASDNERAKFSEVETALIALWRLAARHAEDAAVADELARRALFGLLWLREECGPGPDDEAPDETRAEAHGNAS